MKKFDDSAENSKVLPKLCTELGHGASLAIAYFVGLARAKNK
jgi:hypothetical protein